MGFGFNLGMIFIVLPLTGILILLSIITNKKFFGQALMTIWGGLFALIILRMILSPFSSKKVLDETDYIGDYVVNRDYFSGKQSDWQYNHFRFTITRQNKIYFYETNGQEITKTTTGSVYYINTYPSVRLRIYFDSPKHHILSSNATTYRNIWDFYLVFHSHKFNNVFFKKGKWKPLQNRIKE